MIESVHKTVLLKETIEGLDLKNKSLVLDATFGGGGHSKEILEKYPNIKVIAFDQDKSAWEKAKNKFKGLEKRIFFVNKNFRSIDEIPEKEFDAIIFDLGLSSDQLENSGRGFSFIKNEPLLMTMKENPLPEDLTAMDIVNNWGEKNLADIIYGYGEERFSRRIAKAIVESRENKEIKTTWDLVEIIANSVPMAYKKGRLHFATKTFQALRIAVNDELGTLKIGLEKGLKILKKEGRIAVISFHSLEDRIVKRFFSAKGGSASGGKEDRIANIITKKPIIPTEEEIKNNPRSRSAKLRVLEKIK